MLPAVIGVALLSMLIAFSISEKNDALSTLVTTQAVLIVIGAAITTTAVSSAREPNMLDLHRITLSPSQIAVGFLLGPSVLMWLLAAVIVPFIIIRSGFHAELWGYLIALIVSGLTWQCFGLLLGVTPWVIIGVF